MFRVFYIPTILIIAFSYPITTVVLLKIGADTSAANYNLKLLYFAMAAASLFFSLQYAKRGFQGLGFLLFFFLLYSFRVSYDVLGRDILLGYQTPEYVFGYLIALTLIPLFAMAMAFQRSDVPAIMKGTFIALVLVNLFLLWHSLTADSFSSETAFSGRVEVAGDLKGTAVLNPLTFGIMGAMLGAFIIGLLTTGPAVKLPMRLFYFFMLVVAGTNILFSGSRGPALAFILTTAVTLFFLVKAPFSRSKLKTRQTTWVYVFGVVAATVYFISTTENSILLIDRFTAMYENRTGSVAEERDYIFATAVDDFLGNPFFGNSYILSTGEDFPHNILLEAMISTGVVGTTFFVLAVCKLGIGIWRGLNGIAGYYGHVLALCTLSLATLGLTSYSIGQSPELWIFAGLMTIIGYAHKKMPTQHNVQSSIRASRASQSAINWTIPHQK